MTIETRAFARAGLLGNPSDGYFGKIIAMNVKNFYASVSLQESEDLRIEEEALIAMLVDDVDVRIIGEYSTDEVAFL